MNRLPLASYLLLLSILAGCATQHPHEASLPPLITNPGLPPVDVLSIPDPIPKAEPRSVLGNPPFYDVLGKRYFVLANAVGFVERGIASWYGPGFHKERTSTGDLYDMYSMTAAHKTLPLPCYARVTNLSNGRSVVVYINDRGPFKEGRIIDLSYTAASKLDMLRAGTAPVELQVISPAFSPAFSQASIDASKPPAQNALFIQAGAFGDAVNAERLATKLRAAGYSQVAVRKDTQGPRPLTRVRIGPIDSVEEFDRMVTSLKSIGVSDSRLATD